MTTYGTFVTMIPGRSNIYVQKKVLADKKTMTDRVPIRRRSLQTTEKRERLYSLTNSGVDVTNFSTPLSTPHRNDKNSEKSQLSYFVTRTARNWYFISRTVKSEQASSSCILVIIKAHWRQSIVREISRIGPRRPWRDRPGRGSPTMFNNCC